LTAIACAVFFYLTEPRHVYFLYRCISGAKDILACWMAKPTAFKITTMGITYEGNTLDEIDAHILYDGAYEKAEMFFCVISPVAEYLSTSEPIRDFTRSSCLNTREKFMPLSHTNRF